MTGSSIYRVEAYTISLQSQFVARREISFPMVVSSLLHEATFILVTPMWLHTVVRALFLIRGPGLEILMRQNKYVKKLLNLCNDSHF